MAAFHLQKPKEMKHCKCLLLYNLSARGTERTCVGYSAQPSREGHKRCISPAKWRHTQESHRNSWRYHPVRLCFLGDRVLMPATQYIHLWSWRSYDIWKRQLEVFHRNIFFSLSPSSILLPWTEDTILPRSTPSHFKSQGADLIPSPEAAFLLWCWRQSSGRRFWPTLP